MRQEERSDQQEIEGQAFFIQPGHIRVRNARISKDDDFRDVFPLMFSENDESMYLFWHQIPIRFHYTFDCFASLGKLIDTLELIAENQNGNAQLIFLTENVSAEWNINWSGQCIKIDSIWTSREELTLYADALNLQGQLEITTSSFLAEWKLPLIQVLNAIDAGKGRNLNDSIEVKVEQIGTILKSVDAFGINYSKT